MNAARLSKSDRLQRVLRRVRRLLCWWRGHDFRGPLGGDIKCECGIPFEYEAAIWEGVPKELKRWASWRFGKCRCCGKRFGDHSDCLPF